MNLTIKLLKVMMVFAAALTAFASSAVNKVYIEDFTVDNYEVKNISVMLESSEVLTQAQCTVTLPAGLTVNGTVSIPETTFPGFMTQGKYNAAKNTVEIACANLVGSSIPVGTNVMAVIPVQAKAGTLDENSTAQIEISEIRLVPPAAGNAAESMTSSATVTFVRNSQETFITLQCTNAPVVVNPGDTRQGSIGLNTNVPLAGLQFDIMVPEHLKLSNFQKTDRLPANMMVKVTDHTADMGLVNVAILGIMTNMEVGEGDILTFDITADYEFFASDFMSFSDIVGSDEKLNETVGTGARFEVISGQVAFEKAYMAISEGDDSLSKYVTDAMNTINEECPLVAEDYNMFPYFQKVSALMSAVEKAYEDYTLTPDFENIVTKPIAELKAEIDAVVAEAKAAQAAEEKRRADNLAAYNADNAAIADLQAALDAAIAQVREEYPDYEDKDAEAAIQTQIDDITAAVEAAYKAVETEGNYDYKLNAEPVLNAIAALVPAAAEAYRVNYNDTHYDEDMAKLDELQDKYDAALEVIKEKNPAYLENADVKNIQADIDAARAAVEAEYARVEKEGFYEAPAFDYESIATAIDNALANIPSGVDVIYGDFDMTDVEIYTLDGRRHNAPVRGQINIIKHKDNSVNKVIVK